MAAFGTTNAVQWDTFSNKIIFNIEKGSLDGQLVLKKTPDGRIDMYIVKNHDDKYSAREEKAIE